MLETFVHKDINAGEEIKSFIDSQDDISVFQSLYFHELSKRSESTDSIIITCRKSGKIAGIMLVQIQNYFGKALGMISKRAVITGGPHSAKNDSGVTDEILREYGKYIRNRVVYTQVRRLYQNHDFTGLFLRNGYVYSDHLNYIIDLSKGEEECWKNLHSKRRNEVRKAIKEGITFSEIHYDKEMDSAYNILKSIYGKARLPLPEGGFFDTAFEIMGRDGVLRIFGGYFEGKLIGVMYILCYKGVMYDWYAGSYPEYLKKCPNDLITWEVIRWGANNGYRTFDFGGAGSPGKEYGVRDFKKKFGGIEINTGRFELVHKPSVMKFSKKGFRLWQIIRRRK
ncbi:MAG TPA: GNAT family N-acetyltransferase [Ignavibacteria bacterium]|nr:GNAT family N-acetyltransferase [Ignavibacteria bacterium]